VAVIAIMPRRQLTAIAAGVARRRLMRIVLYLNALSCPAGREGGVMDSITDCP
jgi:hypothetical protein